MIKLTLNPESNPLVRTFHKNVVTIGSGSPPEVDLILSDTNLLPAHLMISEQEGQFFVVNLAKDPFVTLNGTPFGKKVINNRDILQVGNTLIEFNGDLRLQSEDQEGKNSEEKAKEKPNESPDFELKKKLDALIESKLQMAYDSAKAQDKEPDYIDVDKELSLLEEQLDFGEETEKLDLSLLMEEFNDLDKRGSDEADTQNLENVDNLVNPQVTKSFSADQGEPSDQESSPPKTERPSKEVKSPRQEPPAKKAKVTQYPRNHEMEDESEGVKPEKKERKLSPYDINVPKPNNWRLLAAIVFSILTFAIITVGVVYVNISDKTEEEEIKAAEGVADVAMALTYAQLNHINSQSQNWSDPEFLRNNLTAILNSDNSVLANVDSHGHFNNCPYILRIYTNNDFSHFLVLALPAPSLLQWLIPKNAIIVDSCAMELRKIQDLRVLNRLLVNPNTLEGTNGIEISQLIKRSPLLPLGFLANKTHNPGLSPPQELAEIAHGAENMIYNAPRYYQFGESFIKRATNLIKAPESGSSDLFKLQQEMSQLSKLPHLVLYSTQGLEAALQAQKALKTFVPQNKFLLAYLDLDKNGKVISSHLIEDEEITRNGPGKSSNVTPHSLHPSIDLIMSQKDPDEEIAREEINNNHPLKFQLSALSTARHQALKPMAAELIELLNAHTKEYNSEFHDKFAKLLREYELKDQEMRDVIVEELASLYENYSSMPLAEVLPYTKAAGLDHIVGETLKDRNQKIGTEELSREQFEEILSGILSAETIKELESAVAKASGLLTLKYVPKPDLLIAYQNTIRNTVSAKLEAFLLSSKAALPEDISELGSRNSLQKLMDGAWISDQDERDFFLQEFDRRTFQTAQHPGKAK